MSAARAGDRARAVAAERYDGGSNCAQAVEAAVAAVLAEEVPRLPEGAYAAWSGGIGREGCLCGALAAGVILAGMRAAADFQGPRAVRRGAERRAAAIEREFAERFGGTCCRVVRGGLEFGTRECVARCREVTCETAALVAVRLSEGPLPRHVRVTSPRERGDGVTTVGIIGGTGAVMPLAEEREVGLDTPYGRFEAVRGVLPGVLPGGGREAVFVRRHGPGHARLSSQVDHRANVWGLRECGAQGVIATTVCGVLDTAVGLGRAIVFDDLFFPDNRLPDGSPCTFFDTPEDPRRGHAILGSPFSPSLRSAVLAAAREAGVEAIGSGCYGYVLGPRFNSRAEVLWLRSAGVTAVSQTAGPEAVLAAELELPYALLGFGVDFANGAAEEPTPVEELDANIARSVEALAAVVSSAAASWEPAGFDTGFVYRFG